MTDEEKICSTGGWGTQRKPSGKKFPPPIWPGVYVWLLVGVIYIIAKLFGLEWWNDTW